jgi:HK97 family phage portal protein
MLTRLIRAATPENPRFNLNDPQAWDALGPSPASSGFRVNREIAATHSPWFRACNLLATGVAKIHTHVLEGKTRDTDHPAYFLLRWKPNEFQDAFTFKRQLTGQAASGGNGYAYIFRNGDASPRELVPLDPDITFPVRADGVLHYVTTVNSEQRKLQWTDVLHIRGFGHDGLIGYNVVDKGREILGLGMAARKYQAVFFRNSGRAGVVLECPVAMDPKARRTLAEDWDRMQAGLDNAHRTAVADRGIRARIISFSAQDSALIDTRKFDLIDISNITGVPPHKLGDTSRASYNSLEQEDQAFLDDALDPWMVNWEYACWDKLLTEEEKRSESHQVMFWRKGFVRANANDRANYNRVACGGLPWRTVNEVREEEGDEPIDGGDELPRPKNMDYGDGGSDPANPADPEQPATQPPAEDSDVAPSDPARALTPEIIPKNGEIIPDTLETSPAVTVERNLVKSALAEVLVEACGRMVRRVCSHAKGAAKEPKSFLDWIESIKEEHLPVFRESLAPIERAALAAGQLADGETARLPDWLDLVLRGEFLELSSRVTAAQLHQSVIDLSADLAERLPAAAVERYFPRGKL